MSQSKPTTSAAIRQISIGDRFGRWTVIGLAVMKPYPLKRSPGFQKAWYQCLCDCGNSREIAGYALRSEHSRSCGCLGREKAAERKGVATKHGASIGGKPIPEYNVWCQMRQRCLNPNATGYENYGGRGIAVCAEWKNDFGRFYADMGPRPSPKHMIERSDNDQGYSKANCVWASRKEQMMNRRNVVFIEHDGKRMTATDWARSLGLSHVTVMRRFRKGLPIPVVLSNGHVRNGKVYHAGS